MYKFATEQQDQAYQKLIDGTSKLAPSPVIEFGFAALDAMENNDISSTPGTFPSPLTGMNLTTNVQSDPYDKAFATFEKDFWSLDGKSRKIAPDEFSEPQQGQDNAFGFVSSVENASQLSDENGNFPKEAPVVITIELDRVNAWLGTAIEWWQGSKAGVKDDEYAVDFDLTTYDMFGNEVYRIPVRDNNSVDWSNHDRYDSVKAVKITVYKWSRSSRRVRMKYVELGQIFRYESDQIRNIEYSAEGNPLSLTMPSSQFRVTLLDRNNEFDADNPQGKFKYLTQNLPLRVSVKQEYFDGTQLEELRIPIGTFYLDDWFDGENESEYVFVAKDLIGLLDKATFYKGRKYSDLAVPISMEDWLEVILDDARLTLYAQGMWAYKGIKDFKVFPIMPEVSHRDAVQLVCNANACTAYPNREGKLEIRPRDDTRNDYTITASMQEDRFPNPDRLPPLARTLFRYYKYSPAVQLKTQEIQFVMPAKGTTETTYISLSGMVDIQSVTFSDATGVSYTAYGSGIELTLFGSKDEADVRTATVTLYAVEEISSDIIIQNIDEYGQEVIGEDLEVQNKTVISGPEGQTGIKSVKELATWVNNEALSRRTYKLNVRPDLRLDVGDLVKLYRPNLDPSISPDKTIWVRILSKKYGLSDAKEYMTITVRGGGYEDV